jgi:hypothetical protein
MSAIDYLAEAKVKSEAATHISHTDPQVLAVIAEGQLLAAIAQAEFTEALVEQQRITNLLQFLATPPVRPDGWNGWHLTAQSVWAENRVIECRKIDAEIREALGLA